MRDLDYQLLKRLQAELGRLRQAEIARRRAANLPALLGEDAHQHGKALVQRVVGDYESQLAESGQGGLVWEIRQDLVEALEARLFGAGSLQLLLDDESVENIDINGFRDVFVEYADGTTAKVRPVAASNEELIETIQTLAAHEGLSARAFDVANVRVNLRLPDGSRLYAVQSVTREPVVSIRKHRHTPGRAQGPDRAGHPGRGAGGLPRRRGPSPQERDGRRRHQRREDHPAAGAGGRRSARRNAS